MFQVLVRQRYVGWAALPQTPVQAATRSPLPKVSRLSDSDTTLRKQACKDRWQRPKVSSLEFARMREKLATPAKSLDSTQLEIAHKALVMLSSTKHFRGEGKMHREQACLNFTALNSFNPLQAQLMSAPHLVIKTVSPNQLQVNYDEEKTVH